MIWILKTLVGSRAHGLHTEQSDYDYRGVFVQPTREILSLRGTTQQTSWVEGRRVEEAGAKQDDTAWEIGHFLKLASQCNPTILEVFAAPVVESTPDGDALRALLPAVWDPVRVRDAFVGYGLNQRKKMLEDKDKRPAKYATAYLRTLVQAERLLIHGVLPVDMRLHEEFQTLLCFKNGLASVGAVVDKCREWERRVEAAMKATTAIRQKPDPDVVDAFLLDVRQRYWNGAPE
jgi:predicted nucleotidyltransferase